MASKLAWLDFSERERRQALDVIDLFQEEDTRDELGIGVIRDAFADHFFPGTSTIQTRLRYFLFVPWILQQLEASRTPTSDIKRRSRSRQGRLCSSLIAGGEEVGVIGYRAGINVQRLPSNVYWNGLKQWGILRFNGSEADYQRGLDGYYARQRDAVYTDEGEPVSGSAALHWDPHLPAAPDDLLSATTFNLSPAEVAYITDRIHFSSRGSLLAQIIDLQELVDDASRFPWEHVNPEAFDETTASTLMHARNFSEALQGAALLYNLMLAEASKRDGVDDAYHDKLGEWWDGLCEREQAYSQWDQPALWNVLDRIGARVPIPTRDFVDRWFGLIDQQTRLEDLVRSRAARQLIKSREAKLKGPRARLDNASALERWSGAAGTAQLDYRWNRPVRSFINDLLASGLEED